MNLSVVIITKNAENTIADTISSVSFADEIIIVDNGSEDRTVEIADRMGTKVFKHVTSDFSQLRNYGLEKVKGEWIFYIDADEQVTSELARNIRYQISRPKDVSPLAENTVAFKIKRKNFYLGNHEWPYVEEMERLFLRKKLKGWQGKLHETPIVYGKISQLEGFLLHYTHRDLTSMLQKTIAWSDVEAELRIAANHPKITWWRFPRVMTSSFFNSYIKQRGWKMGTAGLVESIYQAFSMFVTYAKLWERQREKE